MTASPESLTCTEKQLLACCAHTEPSPETAARIREFAARDLDWDYVVSQAQENSIAALVERNSRAAASDLVPENVAAKLAAMTRTSAIRCLAMSAELIRVIEFLESRGIVALPYKGPIAAAQAYGDMAARQFEDLDLVLHHRDIAAADEAIRSLGYAPKFPWILSADGRANVVPGEYNYSHAERDIILELHTELTLRHFPVAPKLDEFFAHAVTVNLGGHALRTFCAEDGLIMLVVHGSKDFWAKLIWLADVAELIRSHPALDWDLVNRTAAGLGVQRMFHVALALAMAILEAKLPVDVAAEVSADTPALTLAREVATRLLNRDTRDLTANQRFHFRRRMVPGTAAGWRYAMRLTLAPAEEDWRDSRAPGTFGPLRSALRPFRLLRKYGWSGR